MDSHNQVASNADVNSLVPDQKASEAPKPKTCDMAIGEIIQYDSYKLECLSTGYSENLHSILDWDAAIQIIKHKANAHGWRRFVISGYRTIGQDRATVNANTGGIINSRFEVLDVTKFGNWSVKIINAGNRLRASISSLHDLGVTL